MVYFDPPYHPLSQTASFTKYYKLDFKEEEQIRLSEVFKMLDRRGCYVLLSNSNTKFIKDLYKDFGLMEISANRYINSKPDRRGKRNFEILVKNWDSIRGNSLE